MTEPGPISGRAGARRASAAKAAVAPAPAAGAPGAPTPTRVSQADALVRSPGAALGVAFADLQAGQSFNLVSGTRVGPVPVRGRATVVSVGPNGAELMIDARVPVVGVKKLVRVTLRPGRDGMLHGRAEQLTGPGGPVREVLWSARMAVVASSRGRLTLREPNNGMQGGLTPTADGGFRLEAPGATFVARP